MEHIKKTKISDVGSGWGVLLSKPKLEKQGCFKGMEFDAEIDTLDGRKVITLTEIPKDQKERSTMEKIAEFCKENNITIGDVKRALKK
jgi:DNA gyrase/topoisomerase IV subunit A